MELLYNEEEFCCNLPLPKLDIISTRQESHSFIFSEDIPVDVRLVVSSNVGKLTIGDKLKKFHNHHRL